MLHGVADLGYEYERADFPAMPTRFGSRNDQNVDARFDLLDRVFLRAHQRRDGYTARLAHLEHVTRRYAERVRDQFDRMRKRDVDDARGACTGQEAAAARTLILVEVARVDLVLREDVAREVAMLLRHTGQQALGRVLVRRRHARRRDQIDAVRLTADVCVDPTQFDFERLGVVPGRAEHAHATRLRYFDDDVATMRERDQWELDAEHLANG